MIYYQVQEKLNEFAQQVIMNIISKYSSSLPVDTLSRISELQGKDFISVDEATMDDLKLFSEQEGITDESKYSIDYLPAGHGGRTKEDGIIHIYPESRALREYKLDDLVDVCIKDIVIHEIFHYIIWMNVETQDPVVESYGHFLTEGFVQKFSDIYALDNRLPLGIHNYGKNVEEATRIMNSLLNNYSPEEVNKIIFNSNCVSLQDENDQIKELFQNYKDDYNFKMKLGDFIKAFYEENNISITEQELSSTIKHFKKMSDRNEIVSEISEYIRMLSQNDNSIDSSKYIMSLNQLVSNQNTSGTSR